MAETIPYDPTILLGHIIPPEKFQQLKKISILESEITSSREELEALITMKRSFEMTKLDLINLGIDTRSFENTDKKINDDIKNAAKSYAELFSTNQEKIFALKRAIPVVEIHTESPIDFQKSLLKRNLPLASDSLKLNGQYFSFNREDQDAENNISALKSFVSSEVSFLGETFSSKISTAAQSHTSMQRENHDIDGTLVITATCTHAKANIFSPFIIDVDKGIRAWNQVYSKDMIKIDIENVADMAAKEGTEDEKSMNIVSGATYGSCFVGMVHVLKRKETTSSQKMASAASNLQTQFDMGSWFANYSGGFGVDSSFSNDIKSLVSQQTVSAHISLICEGCIPSVASNAVSIGVDKFSNFDAGKMMEQLAVLHNDTSGNNASMHSAAEAARTGGKMISIRGAEVKNVMLSLGEIKEKDDKILDVNSLMTSFEDYITKASSGDVGIPINFLMKPITKAQLAQMWIAKYYPGKFVTSSGDDSGTPSRPDQPGRSENTPDDPESNN